VGKVDEDNTSFSSLSSNNLEDEKIEKRKQEQIHKGLDLTIKSMAAFSFIEPVVHYYSGSPGSPL